MVGKKYRITGVVLSLFLLTSCAGRETVDVTEPDQNPQEETESVIKAEDTKGLKKITLEALADNQQQEIEKVMQMECKNLNFVQDFSFAVPEEIGKYQVMCMDHFQDNWDVVAEKYIPEDLYDESKVVDDNRSYPYGPEFHDEETGRHVSIGCTGFFSYAEKSSESVEKVCYYDEAINKKSYYLKSDDSDDTYTLHNEDISVHEAAELAGEFVSDFTETVEYPQNLDAGVAVAHQLENKEWVLEIIFRNLYKGIPICTMSPTIMDDVTMEMVSGSIAKAYLDDADSINWFTSQCAFEDYETVETYHSIVTPESAAELLSEKLSGCREYDVVGMELIYCPVLMQDENSGDGVNGIRSGSIVELTPYWAIYMDVTPSFEIYGLVNCVTGEVEFINNQR